jgi:hypothetical protein
MGDISLREFGCHPDEEMSKDDFTLNPKLLVYLRLN